MKKGDEILVVVETLYVIPHVDRRQIATGRVERVDGVHLWWRSHTLGAIAQQLRLDERGVTWAPAWRADEAAAFRVAVALEAQPT